MELVFSGEVWYWRGPAPFHFVTVPADESAEIHEVAPAVTYGWGMIPVRVRIGETELPTSLWPKDGAYIVPVKKAMQDAEGIGVGDIVTVALTIAA